MEAKRSKTDRWVPLELQIEVLLRLPVKSLVRFVSVFKTWQSLIKDSTFIRKKSNLSHADAAGNKHLLVRRQRRMIGERDLKLSMHRDNEKFRQDYVDLEIAPPVLPQQKIIPCGITCFEQYLSDGEVLCIESIYDFILWNPSINKTVSVPIFDCEKEMQLLPVYSYGFGFDAKANDYKVFRIGYPAVSTISPQLKRAEIFSVREGCWRDIVGELPQHLGRHPVCLNGFIYWICTGEDMNEDMNWILTFDLSAEKFGKIDLPDILAYQSEINLQLTVFEDSISLFLSKYIDYIGVNNICSLWMKKEEDVWTKIWSYGPADVTPLGFRLNGEILLEGHYGQLLALDLKTQSCRSLGIRGWDFQVDAYVESLALFNY